MEDIIEAYPDTERAKSLLEMANIRIASIKLMKQSDIEKFTSKIIEEYYDTLHEIITAIISADGYKVKSDILGPHIITIEYMKRYKEIETDEIDLMDDLRKKRIGIKYYGRHVSIDYLLKKETRIKNIIEKLKLILENKLKQ